MKETYKKGTYKKDTYKKEDNTDIRIKRHINLRAGDIYSRILKSVIVFAIIVMCIQSKAATRNGIVNTDGLNVRTGPGTNFDILKSDGEYVRLSNNTRVTIKDDSETGWYYVTFTFNGKKLKGYVASMYVNTDTGDSSNTDDSTDSNADAAAAYNKNKLADNINIAAVMLSKQKIYSKPYKKSECMTVNDNKVYVKKGGKVKVTGVYKVSGERWYRISFTYKKNAYTGYVNSSYVRITPGKKVKSYINNKTNVYTKTSKKAYAKIKKKKIKLKINKKINVTAEKISGGTKWFKIKYVYSGKNRTGWVPAQNVMFVSGKTVKATAAPVSASKETAVPTAKPTSRPVVALSDAQFEAEMTNQGFPESYKNGLRLLHQSYPYWQFTSVKTGLDWNASVDAESVPGKSLVLNTRTIDWKSTEPGAYDWTTDAYKVFDGKQWVAASRAAVAYYMDPRNFLDEKCVFMFEALAYESNYQNVEGVATILKNTPLGGTSYTYTDDTGAQVTKTYQDTIMEAAEINGVSPYHLASRIRQEVVTGTNTVSNSVTGTVSGYEGIFNYYNIGANDSSGGGAVLNGLKYASSGTTYMRPWNSPYRSIVGGAQYIASNYITRGQNTLYTERFNITEKNTYDHQYMTNVAAAHSEANKVYTAYKDWMANVPILFYIPIYDNMPDEPAAAPTGNLSPNNYLRSLTVTGASGTQYAFTPAFNAANGGAEIYSVNVPMAETVVTIGTETVNKNAVVAGAGTIELSAASGTVTVQVTAQNGSVRTYTILIYRF